MPIVADTIADTFDLLIGVDTHAASHTFALINATTGALADTQNFPTSPAGLRRALAWIGRRTENQTVLVVIDGTGSYGAVLTEQLLTAGFLIAEAPDVPAHVRRAAGKTDTLDAVEIARAARGLTPQQLRRPRHAGERTILRVLTSARDQMTSERTRAVNALTALLRTVELGIDARRALSTSTIATIAAWRTPTCTTSTRAVCRTEAIRLARRIRALDTELAANHTALTAAVTAQAPELLELRGVGPVVAATVLHSWSHPGRIHSEAAFAALGGVSPLPASSGNTQRHRLNRGGDRRLNRALYTVALTRLGHDPRTRDYFARRTAEGRTRREIIRSLKRYISRELFRLLTTTQLRPSTT
ncbi:MAG: transposase [Pseudonocardiales bacterium]|jgi:transposase|nr:transposase [Pseudonocardiales bacterium]